MTGQTERATARGLSSLDQFECIHVYHMLNIINTVLIFLLREVLKCQRSFSGIEKHFNDCFVYKHTLHDLSTLPQKKINKEQLLPKAD